MASPLVTLTTDFGSGSPYVAQMKAVILRTCPQAGLVDITHQIPPQNIRYAALVLEDVAPLFPEGTTHVCVVDPGVGTSRPIVLVQHAGHFFVAPDNGLLSRVVPQVQPERVWVVTRSQYWLHPVSATFHGRDIMAPVAARVAAGHPPADFGEPGWTLTSLDWPQPQVEPDQICGQVLTADSFGNLITNIPRNVLERWARGDSCLIDCAGHTLRECVRTYAERPAGTPIALFSSNQRLELAVVQGSAATTLGAGPDAEVRVRRLASEPLPADPPA